MKFELKLLLRDYHSDRFALQGALALLCNKTRNLSKATQKIAINLNESLLTELKEKYYADKVRIIKKYDPPLSQP